MSGSLPDVVRLSRAQRELVWQRVFGARMLAVLIGVVCIWLVYALDWLGVDLLNRSSSEDDSESSHLVLFLVLTLGFVAYGVWDARRGIGLARRGVLVRARVSSISSLQNSGCVPLRYSYVFQGKSYGGACDIAHDIAENLVPGQQFWLLVDRNRPRNSDYVHALAMADNKSDEDEE